MSQQALGNVYSHTDKYGKTVRIPLTSSKENLLEEPPVGIDLESYITAGLDGRPSANHPK